MFSMPVREEKIRIVGQQPLIRAGLYASEGNTRR